MTDICSILDNDYENFKVLKEIYMDPKFCKSDYQTQYIVVDHLNDIYNRAIIFRSMLRLVEVAIRATGKTIENDIKAPHTTNFFIPNIGGVREEHIIEIENFHDKTMATHVMSFDGTDKTYKFVI
jgi:hypothetical protein